jgi:protein-S-isoprenylcysteine O-methyltransferase Ste14
MPVAGAHSSVNRRPLERIGAWVFAQRSWLPVPLALLLIGVRWHWIRSGWLLVAGLAIVAAGLAIRGWAVRHIGTISRTRSARLGPLMNRGPFALVRNPLYVGNFLMWIGFAVSSGLIWMVPVAWAIFALQYTAIIRFEEAALTQHFGEAYLNYMHEVPRWGLSLGRLSAALRDRGEHAWREVAFSERGTLIAAAAITALLVAKYYWA